MPQKKTGTKIRSRLGDEAVRAKTGKSWSEWLSILDKAGAMKMNHREITDYLYRKKRLPSWWGQMVAAGYEQARNMRKVHETSTGFQSSISKTVKVPISTLYRAWIDAKARDRWLPKAPITIRKATANKSIRVAWNGTISNMDVRFYAKGGDKSQIVIDQTKLKSPGDVARMKQFWREELEKLRKILEV